MPDPQPVITIAVSDALARIEGKLDTAIFQMAAKADAAVVHEMEARLRVLETTQASAAAVAVAASRARAGFWVAAGALAAALSALAYMITVVSRLH